MSKTIQVAPQGAGAQGARLATEAAPIQKYYTVVVYERRRVKTVVVYIGRETFTFKIPAYREVNGVVKKTWMVGDTKAYVMYVRAGEVAELIHAYAYEEATRKISLLDSIFRAAVVYDGYKVHDNALYVELWLSAPLGTPLFRAGDPRERELGACIKHFTNSYNLWRMVTPPWATTIC